MIWVNPRLGHIVAFLNNTLYDDYLCLVALTKQHSHWTKTRKNPEKHWFTGNSKAGTDSSKPEVVIAMKSLRIIQYLAFHSVRWSEDKYAQRQPQ